MGFGEGLKPAVDELKRTSPGLDSLKDAYQKFYENATSAGGQIGAAGEGVGDLLRLAAADAARIGSSTVAPVLDAWNHASRAAAEAPRLLAGWMPEEDKRQEIARVLKEAGLSAADVAIREAARSVPYGPQAYSLVKDMAGKFSRIQMEGSKGPTPKFSAADPELKRKVQTLEEELVDLRARFSALTEHLRKSGELPSPTLPLAGLQPDRASSTAAAGIRGPTDVIGVFLREGFKGGDFLDALIVPVPRGKAAVGSPSAAPDV